MRDAVGAPAGAREPCAPVSARLWIPAMAPPLPQRADVVVVGAGFAGLATAASLVELGVRRVVVLEAEPIPGKHGSGRNAAMARRLIEDDVLSRLAVRSVARMGELGNGTPLVRRVGGLLVGEGDALDALARIAAAVPELAAEVERLDADAVRALVPALAGADLAGGILTPGCGVTDIHALLGAFADRARAGGATTFLRTPLTGIRVAGGRVVAAETPHGVIATEQLVNAAGFAANPVAAFAGLAPLPLVPTRRHLFVTAPWGGLDRAAPFVWNVSAGYYFRPEGTGLLLCACDGTAWPPEDPPTDPGAREALAAKFDAAVPGLREVRPTRGWAGLRVMTPDHRFVIGADPRLTGFFWVAGLGGHGMTTSAGVGEIAARGLVDGAVPAPFGAAFAPDRFTTV